MVISEQRPGVVKKEGRKKQLRQQNTNGESNQKKLA